MLIQRDINNWSFSTEEQNGFWHLIYDNNNNVVTLFKSIGITSTQENLFVSSTKQECEQYITDNGLIYYPENIPVEVLIIDENVVTEDVVTDA